MEKGNKMLYEVWTDDGVVIEHEDDIDWSSIDEFGMKVVPLEEHAEETEIINAYENGVGLF